MFGTERWQAYGHQARIRCVYLGDANVMRQCLGVAYQHVGSGCEFVNDITCTIERRVQDYGLFAPVPYGESCAAAHPAAMGRFKFNDLRSLIGE